MASSQAAALTDLEQRVALYLAHRMPGTSGMQVKNLRRIPGGNSKENLVFDASWLEGQQSRRRRHLIRRELPAGVLDTSVETEFRIMDALRGTRVPVPQMYWYEPESSWLDRPFIVTQFVRGESSPERFATDPQLKSSIADHFVEVLAAQHRVDWARKGLDFLGIPADALDCSQRLIDHWSSVLDRYRLEPQPMLVALLQWLEEKRPRKVRRIALCHGDPGPGNFLYRDGKIVAVVDWEMAHLGDPMDDVGWTCWRAVGPGSLFERDEFLDKYRQASGEPVDRESVLYYEVLSNVRAAIACVTGMHAFCTGGNYQPNMGLVGLGVYRRCLIDGARLAGF
ncbi:MAG TPA: phosphotransferase family protein [Dehalococcoidia bacterium]|nr:phosphotransferase family protein [Dehalococcoidia bacterium]